MSIYKKYSYKSGCGCTSGGKTYSSDGCCETPVADPPCPLCEAHCTELVPTQCFFPACNVTATDDKFFIKFKNVQDNEVPVNASEVFFYHAVAGLMNIHSFSGSSYEVSLTDPTKVNSVIQEDDCVLTTVVPSEVFTSTSNIRCLCGKFNPPNLNDTETIYIFNGTGIPVGATLTFTYEGETGSYLVQSFDSASGSVFAYTVQNTGNGHTPGNIIDGGSQGECTVPIEIVTETDLCNLSETQVIAELSGCLNGSPRALVPTSEGQVPIANSNNEFELQRFTNTDCCFFIEGCLKFQESDGCLAESTAIVKSPVPTCVDEKIEAGQAGGGTFTPIPIIIDNLPFVITGWNPGNSEITIAPKDESIFNGETFIEYPDGTELCFGECCNTCVGGVQITDHNAQDSDPIDKNGAVIAWDIPVAYVDGQFTRYIVGVPQNTVTGFVEAQVIDATWNDNPSSFGPGIPRLEDNLMIRQKICNSHPKGCNQVAEIRLNYELSFEDVPEGVSVHWEVGHFAWPSTTLEDGTTPNPFSNISAQATDAGKVTGPSHVETDFITGTAIGPGNQLEQKAYPFIAQSFLDRMDLQHCDCGNSIVWLFIKIETPVGAGSGDIQLRGGLRRIITKFEQNFIDTPINDPDLPY